MEILGLDVLKSAIIIVIILLYWKFVYYKYHKKAPLSFFVIGGPFVIYGIYLFAKGLVTFSDVAAISYIVLFFLIISFSLVLVAIKRHGLKSDVDLTLTWARKTFPFLPYWFWMIISPVLFFFVVSTYWLIGREYVIFWGMIFLAWIFSNRRLYRKEIAK